MPLIAITSVVHTKDVEEVALLPTSFSSPQALREKQDPVEEGRLRALLANCFLLTEALPFGGLTGREDLEAEVAKGFVLQSRIAQTHNDIVATTNLFLSLLNKRAQTKKKGGEGGGGGEGGERGQRSSTTS